MGVDNVSTQTIELGIYSISTQTMAIGFAVIVAIIGLVILLIGYRKKNRNLKILGIAFLAGAILLPIKTGGMLRE